MAYDFTRESYVCRKCGIEETHNPFTLTKYPHPKPKN